MSCSELAVTLAERGHDVAMERVDAHGNVQKSMVIRVYSDQW